MGSKIKKVLCFALVCGVLASALPGTALAATWFTDVSPNAWYASAVNYVSSNHLMSGLGDNSFGPDVDATRGQMVTILYRMEGQPAVSGTSSFKDVYNDYYKNAVIWASKNGIVSGSDGGYFFPTQGVTREQMATIFYRYASYKKYNVSQTGNAVFADQWQISTYAFKPMSWAVGVGLLGGTDQNMLLPQHTTSRAQLATALMRFANQYNVKIPTTTATSTTTNTATATATATVTIPNQATPTAAVPAGMTASTTLDGSTVMTPSYQFRWPVQGYVSSAYGSRYIFGSTSFHRGIDIPAAEGTAVHAGAAGTVIFAGENGSYGKLVIIDHGNGFQTYYAHNSASLVAKGDVVSQGQTIAAAGSTGRVTGPHCHFEVRYRGQTVSPLDYLPATNNAPANEMVVAAGV